MSNKVKNVQSFSISDGGEETMSDEETAQEFLADWNDISIGIRKDIGAQQHNQWIKPITPGRFCKDTGTLELYLPSAFSANWVNDRFADRLALAWKITRPDVQSVQILAKPGANILQRVRASGGDTNMHTLPQEFTAITSHSICDAQGIDKDLQFGNYLQGENNILASNAGERMAAREKPQFSPLYIKAPTGQGKTHLLHAIANRFSKTMPDARIYYCSAEKFMVEFVSAMRRNEVMEFKNRLRSFDMLLVDDIQFIIGKNSTQEEFLHTVDALMTAGKRLVFASDRAPQSLDGVDQRLLSRLSMGLVADIAPAGVDLRRKILRHHIAHIEPSPLNDDVIEFLARTISRNLRELVGALNKLIAYTQLTGQPMSLGVAESQLTDILTANRRRVTIDEIQRTVCHYYKLDRSEMASKRRARAIVRPRQVAMYLAKVLTPRSYPEIGRKFGGRDHSTVIHAVRLIEDLRVRDQDMDSDVRSLLQQLES